MLRRKTDRERSSPGESAIRPSRGLSAGGSAFLLAGLVSCSGGAGVPGTGGTGDALLDEHDLDLGTDGDVGDIGRTGGAESGAPTENMVVGMFDLAAPTEETFFLHGTLPVPPGTYMDGYPHVPLTVLNADGRHAATQVNVVSKYPDERRDGADVVEIVARVDRPENATPGDRIQYQVIHKSQRDGAFKETRATRAFLAAPSSLTLHTKDVFGNTYKADLLRDIRKDDGNARVLRNGKLVREWETHEVMRSNDNADNKLDHLMGVHTYVSQWRQENIFTVAVRVHNGMSGHDQNNPLDDAYKEIYFDQLELRLPQGWTVVQAFDDPFIGEPTNDGGWRRFPIIRPMDDGSMHVMKSQGQFSRRFAVAPEEDAERARSMIEAQNLGFARRGISPDGVEMWSWWNPLTSRWMAQNVRLPEIDNDLLPVIRQEKRSEFFNFEDHLRDGTHHGYPLVDAPMGFYRPWGGPYGGMTGGVEIDLSFGIESVAAGSRDAYRMAQLMGRMYMDRQATALYNLNGQPTRLEDWLQEGPGGLYFPGLFNLNPLLPHHDPFGFGDAPTFQTQAVLSMGKKPAYQDQYLNYKPIDIQHWVRYLRPYKMMAWLGNDALAKSEIAMTAEIYRLTHHEHNNNASGSLAAAWGLRGSMNHVDQYPGQGYTFNRANGWGMDIAASAYAMGDRETRNRFFPWFRQVVDTAEDGQSTCGGYLQAVPHHSNGAQYRIRQNYESAITDNAMRALANTVFRDRNDVYADRIDEIMVRRAYGTISPAFWSFENGAPHGTVAVGPWNASEPAYCGNAMDHWASPQVDTKYVWNSLAYAYELTGDQAFLNKAGEAAGVANLYNEMNNDQLSDINNRFAMLTLLQALNAMD